MAENEKNYYVHREDCSIRRNLADYHKKAVLFDDSNGEVVKAFDGRIPDDEIWRILDLVNEVYDIGYRSGQASKAREIRVALDIRDNAPEE